MVKKLLIAVAFFTVLGTRAATQVEQLVIKQNIDTCEERSLRASVVQDAASAVRILSGVGIVASGLSIGTGVAVSAFNPFGGIGIIGGSIKGIVTSIAVFWVAGSVLRYAKKSKELADKSQKELKAQLDALR